MSAKSATWSPPDVRGQGVGRALSQEIFALALGAGLEKLVAQMTVDQTGAIAIFEGLGFKAEALLRDHVRDKAGKKHDIVVLGTQRSAGPSPDGSLWAAGRRAALKRSRALSRFIGQIA